MSCVVPNCRTYSRLLKKTGKNTSFHRFPENYLREKWIDALGRDNWTPKEHNRICSKHFESDCFVFTSNKRRLLPTAIPTLFQRPPQGSHPNQPSGKDNSFKIILRSNERLPDAILNTSPQPLQESDTDDADDKEFIAYTLGSHMTEQLESKDNEMILSHNEGLLDVQLKTSPQHPQDSDCDLPVTDDDKEITAYTLESEYDLPNMDYDKEIMAHNLAFYGSLWSVEDTELKISKLPVCNQVSRLLLNLFTRLPEGEGSHLDQHLEDEDKKNILIDNEKQPGVMPTTFPMPIQMTCQKCMSITRQYEEKVLKQEEEIKSLSSELEEMKRLLEKSDKDLERVKEVSKRRQQTIWKLRKRVERNLIYPKDYILV